MNKLNTFQEYLFDKRMEYEQARKRRVSDNEYARHLQVSAGSYNQWINGNRLPSYENAVKLSRILGKEIFDVLGYDRPGSEYKSPYLVYIIDNWKALPENTKKEIFDHVKEMIEHGDDKRIAQNEGDPIPDPQ